MNALSTSLSLSRYDAACADAHNDLPHPPQGEIETLGHNIANEMLDALLGTALEEHVPVLMEGLIGGVHSAILRLQRQADRSADEMRRLQRDFDGSEIKDVELQDATLAFNRAEAAVMMPKCCAKRLRIPIPRLLARSGRHGAARLAIKRPPMR